MVRTVMKLGRKILEISIFSTFVQRDYIGQFPKNRNNV